MVSSNRFGARPFARAVVTASLALCVFAGSATAAVAPEFPRGSAPQGTSYLRHARHWSRWIFETPTPQNPLADVANCDAVDGPGAVEFLPPPTDTGQTNTCTVDSTDALVVSPAGSIGYPDPGQPQSRASLLHQVTDSLSDVTRMTVSVDGVRVQHLRRDFFLRDVVGATVPADNLFDLPAGPTPLAFAGYFVVLRPLSAGHHEVVLSVTFSDGGTNTTWDVTTDVSVSA